MPISGHKNSARNFCVTMAAVLLSVMHVTVVFGGTATVSENDDCIDNYIETEVFEDVETDESEKEDIFVTDVYVEGSFFDCDQEENNFEEEIWEDFSTEDDFEWIDQLNEYECDCLIAESFDEDITFDSVTDDEIFTENRLGSHFYAEKNDTVNVLTGETDQTVQNLISSLSDFLLNKIKAIFFR